MRGSLRSFSGYKPIQQELEIFFCTDRLEREKPACGKPHHMA
jgi:hypothetical protein